MDYRPEWVPMVLMYWVMALPYRVGIGSAWMAGIVLDVLEGSVLGLNALGLVVIAYITLILHQRLRMFSSAASRPGFAMVGINLMLNHWLLILTGQKVASGLLFLMAALTSAIIWPSVFRLLRQIRRSFDVH